MKLFTSLFILFLGLFVCVPSVFALPQGFKKTIVASGFSQPTALGQSPDGRIFVLEKSGAVKIVKNGSVLSESFLTLPVSSEGERGLLGIAFDPSFATNNYVYIYYVNADPEEIRVSRFTANGDTANTTTEVVLLRSTMPLSFLHHSGTIRFGADGKLWISVGNNADNANSQTLTNIHGKILRINPDGSIPSDNPFINTSGAAKSIWAYGFRNPFRFHLLSDGRPIVGDVGGSLYEEVNVVEKGGNYGWPQAEGVCTSCPYINPYHAYPHNGNSASVVGGIEYLQSEGSNAFPSSFVGSYFYGDYAQAFIRRIVRDAQGNFVADEPFEPTADAVVDMLQGENGSIYYVTIDTGRIYEIAYTTENLPPTAEITASPSAGLSPLSVSFSASGSSDPQGLPLTYVWDFGDGSATSSGESVVHEYSNNGEYTVTLTASNGTQTNFTTTTILVGAEFPDPSIDTPLATDKYNAGQTISYSGSAIDPQDGNLPDSAYSWTIIFHHQTHVHPFLGPIHGVKSGTFTIPDTGESSHETWYEIQLTVTNSSNLSKTVTRTIYPNTVDMTFQSNPSGLQFTIDGEPKTTPITITGVSGYKRVVDVPSPQVLNNTTYTFSSWSDNGAKTHTIATPNADTTYTINTTVQGSGSGEIRFRIPVFNEDGSFSQTFLNDATVKLTDVNANTVVAVTSSTRVGTEDGWAMFDNVPAGTYGVLVYKPGYAGYWKQTTCTGGDPFQNVAVQNGNTQGMIAAFRNDFVVSTVACHDLGLKKLTKGNIHFRVTRFNPDQSFHSFLNGVTAKLTDPTGTIVYRTAISQPRNGQDGWVEFKDLDVGTYGLMIYKFGYVGSWKQTDCTGGSNVENVTIQNEHTEQLVGAFRDDAEIIGGQLTQCRDLGLTQLETGNIHFRIPEFKKDGSLFRYLNGVTAKLTDTSGNFVYATASSAASTTYGTQDGWVIFNNVPKGTYGMMVYKSGYKGYWKQTTCTGGDPLQNVTIQNSNTEGYTAAFRNDDTVVANTTLHCRDLGLQSLGQEGTIRFRVPLFASNGAFSNTFVNGATAKLTDTAGKTVYATTTSSTLNSQDGWVQFSNIPTGVYGVMVYKSGLLGYWKQTTCTGGSPLQNSTIQNANSTNILAAFRNDFIESTTACHDLGLKLQ